MVRAQIQIFCLFIESKAIEGERRSTYWCMSAILDSVFFFFSPPYFLLFFYFVLLPFLLNAYFWVMVFPRNSYYCDSESPSQCIARGPLDRACCDQYLLFQPLTAFVQCGCLCQPFSGRQLFSRHHLPVLVVPLPSAKQRRLFYLFACRGFSTRYNVCALSLSIPHGMHLVVLTHLYFFQVACHPNRIFPPKEPKQEHQNRFFPSSHRQTIPSLTSES